MPTYAIEYTYDSRTDLQEEVRPAHRAYLQELLADGTLLASGPLRGQPVHDGPVAHAAIGTAPAGALLLVRAESVEGALGLLDEDPFRQAGVLAARTAREWDPVTGPFA